MSRPTGAEEAGVSARPVPGRFGGKFVLVTGGSTGIGFAAAARISAEGGTVFITGRRQHLLDAAAAALGPSAIAIQGDTTNKADRDRLFTTIRQSTGRLDAVIANAGGGSFAPFGTWTDELFDDRFDVNVKATAYLVQEALPLLHPGASVVLIGSISGRTGLAGLGLYGASKAALRSFARGWSTDLKDTGIRVNTLSPGHIYTTALSGAGISRESYDPILPTIPMGRLGEAEDVAGPIAFLASSDSSYITGIDLVVDGGLTQV